MNSTPWLVLLVLGAIAFAGCSDKKIDEEDPGDGLIVTDDTGVIRGVVVDPAIRPLAGAAVTVADADGVVKEEVTGAEGTFGFDGLAEGTYTVRATKLGYNGAPQAVDVTAGVERPPAVRMILEVDPETTPYYTEYVFDGFIECGFTSPAVGVALCGVVDDETLNEDSQVRYPFDRTPTWIQSELSWQSTQAAGGELALMYSYLHADCDPFYCDHDIRGPSPLVLKANETVAQTLDENETELYIRVFTDDVDDTASPVCTPPTPATNEVCPQGSGVTFQQSFRIVTHVFYGYEPPEDWTFGQAREVPPPPQ